MKIVSIEPTPSPNTMKLNMDSSLPMGKRLEYSQANKHEAPRYAQKLLEIEGVKSIFQATDFIAIERYPQGDWQQILSSARLVFGEEDAKDSNDSDNAETILAEGFGEVNVFIQKFRGIPMQIKLIAGDKEVRVALPDRYPQAALKAQTSSQNLVMERQWEEQGVRYGDVNEIGEEVKREIEAAYDDERIERLVENAFQVENGKHKQEKTIDVKELKEQLNDPDWKKRYAALTRLQPTVDNMPLFVQALHDSHVSIRRFAVAYLGMVEGGNVLPYLIQALKDSSFAVRRTAGDAISDLGDPAAMEEMMNALKDPNKLVRWRAARYMYEVGNEQAIPALEEAQHDPEFEVSMQAKIALERIQGGKEAEGTVWQQITRSRNAQDKEGN